MVALLAWVMMGLALWHFTIFFDERLAGGIVGAFVAALVGAVVFGLVVHGFDVPGVDDTTIVTALEAIPGALIGLGVTLALGSRRPAPAAG